MWFCLIVLPSFRDNNRKLYIVILLCKNMKKELNFGVMQWLQ